MDDLRAHQEAMESQMEQWTVPNDLAVRSETQIQVDEKVVVQAVIVDTMQAEEAVFHIRILWHTVDGEHVVPHQHGHDGEHVV